MCLVASLARADHPTLSLEDGSPGPITTLSAVPLPQGTLSTAVVNQFVYNDRFSDAELLGYSLWDDGVHSTDRVISASLNTAYGLTGNFTLGFSLPYLWRSNLREVTGGGNDPHSRKIAKHGGEDHGDENAPPAVETVGDPHGLGDATLYGQYRILHDETADRHVAVVTGLKIPTGRTDVRTATGGLLSAHHQPGSGSWDPLLGASFTQGLGRWSFDASALYSLATDGTGDSNLGDVFNYNAAVSYRMLGAQEEVDHHHDEHAHEHPTTWDLILEANGDWRDEVVENGAVDGNTGGNLVFLSGGTRLTWGHGWASTLSVGTPVIEDLNGIQSEPTIRILFGVSKAF